MGTFQGAVSLYLQLWEHVCKGKQSGTWARKLSSSLLLLPSSWFPGAALSVLTPPDLETVLQQNTLCTGVNQKAVMGKLKNLVLIRT